uniref:Uncharacterized mitochondrial protein AtMg00810-like n=1 Tax=Nicotiana tabacum TaxID=4097 RepID=A0A1S3Y7W4_TOBAC
MVADHFPDGIYLSQGKYAQEILQCSNMLCSRAVHTPLAQKHGLHEATGSSADSTKYRSIVGALQYLTVTRPELSHAVNLVCQFMQSLYHATFWPKEHFKASLSLVGFSDSDWTGCPINQAFYNRVVCIFGGRIAFPGKQQTILHYQSGEKPFIWIATSCSGVGTQISRHQHPVARQIAIIAFS